jgi:hypothetical protein
MTGGPLSLSRKGPRLAVVLIAAGAVMLSAAGSARADDASVSVSFDGHIRGLAQFHDVGDWLEICDKRQDGLPVQLRYSYIRRDGTTQRGVVAHYKGARGAGTPNRYGQTFLGCSFENHNFGEGRRVWIQACVRRSVEVLTCGKTQVARV